MRRKFGCTVLSTFRHKISFLQKFPSVLAVSIWMIWMIIVDQTAKKKKNIRFTLIECTAECMAAVVHYRMHGGSCALCNAFFPRCALSPYRQYYRIPHEPDLQNCILSEPDRKNCIPPEPNQQNCIPPEPDLQHCIPDERICKIAFLQNLIWKFASFRKRTCKIAFLLHQICQTAFL